ncbi:DUF1572 family protein [Winogradskyella costae]|uniref:DUF1572 family protein n=1 Tax=Winogradskyella costae TaxID=2697008 RepID=UPI0015CAA942|nr:DUF1572 family protein [Winogradskyella costae]
MLSKTLIDLFKRDLHKLIEEINLYKDESHIWKLEGSVTNSAGNLCLHLVGNLNHFIGTTLGNTEYIRQRELEFSLKYVSRMELIKQVEATIIVIENTLQPLSESDLQKDYNLPVFKEPKTTAYVLIHLAMHLAYHLGQINFHRRLLD